MRGHLRVTSVLAGALATLLLVGCLPIGTSGDGGRTAKEAAKQTRAHLELALLTPSDMPVDGFGPDYAMTIAVGEVCSFDPRWAMLTDTPWTQRSTGLSSRAHTTWVSETVWSGSGAEQVVASLRDELTACSGPQAGVWDGTAVTVTVTETYELDLPSAPVTICASFDLASGDQKLEAFGTACFAAADGLLLRIVATTFPDSAGLAAAEFEDVVSVAVAKAFGG